MGLALNDANMIPPFCKLGQDTLELPSMASPKLYVKSHVFVRGSPEHVIWTADGNNTDIMAVLQRNITHNGAVPQSAFLQDQSAVIKAPLTSIKSMLVRFTDEDGSMFELDDDYVVKIGVSYKV